MKIINLVMKITDMNGNAIYFIDDKGNKYLISDIQKLSNIYKFVYNYGIYKGIVRIKYKVKDNHNNILWYTDENNKRYNLNELKSLINNKNYIVNMYIKSGIPTSYDGKIKTYYKKDDILLITEDSKGGYKLYKWFLESSFPLINFICVSAHGYGNLYKTVEENGSLYKKIIIIYDNKLEESGLNIQLNSLNNYLKKNNKQYFYFAPICLEEVILSFKEFLEIQNLVHPLIQLCFNLTKNSIYYFYNDATGCYEIPSMKVYKPNLEKYLTEELIILTKNTPLKYNNKSISKCLTRNCCQSYINNEYNFKFPAYVIQGDVSSCQVNNITDIRHKYYSERTILKNLFISCYNLILNNEISNDLLYIYK